MAAVLARELTDQKCLPTPRASEGTNGGPNQRGSSGDLTLSSVVVRLPTPRAKDSNGGVFPLSRPESMDNLETRIVRLFPTPTAALGGDGSGQPPEKRKAGGHTPTLANTCEFLPAQDWGPYTAAVRRWESILGRAAPDPTELVRTAHRLSPRLPEWMMGLDPGWVTEIPGIPRSAQLKAIGNGVCPQQGAEAVRRLLARMGVAEMITETPRGILTLDGAMRRLLEKDREEESTC